VLRDRLDQRRSVGARHMHRRRTVRISELLGVEQPQPRPLAGAQDNDRTIWTVAADALEFAGVDRSGRQFGDANLGLAADSPEPAGNALRIGRRCIEYRYCLDAPAIQLEKTFDWREPVEREFLDRCLGAERGGFPRQPGRAGSAAHGRGAVDALPIPGGEPPRRAGLRLDKIRERRPLHYGSIDDETREGAMADTLKRSNLKNERAQARGYSQAVITEGGRIVWLAGQVAGEDSAGRSLAADFDGQVREVFARLGHTLEAAGGRLADMVTMTVFITDARLGDRFTELRREIFGDNYPASALITVAGLARPEMLVEVQGIAVIG
jgi:2-iminobutanoate/2-iminopropanoate deaminase